MQVVILAGGKGLRLREAIKDLPKPMAPVSERPFLEYLIMQLAWWGMTEIILSTGYRSDQIQSYFDDGKRWGVNISYSIEAELLGTGGAIKKASELIKEESFIAMNGDSFLELDFEEFISFSKYKGAAAVLALTSVEDTTRYGSIEIDDNNLITKFSEKGKNGKGLINGGVYFFNTEVIKTFPDGKFSVEKDVFPGLIAKRLYGMRSEGFFIDIGLPQDYLDLCNHPDRLLIGAKVLTIRKEPSL
ncbi:hypothetical protein C4544_04865 [candidate division WS5 bacterium]|uniref:Nucleotidyl transferase domain-containing protein n=1 Tax=candidate division WS5 bacterium TaxID=2093353 RepID=A0A419DC19_9BACT|nr:MAG: hypothetical protein C4544_04865 [candidate division WS5 bacterium]